MRWHQLAAIFSNRLILSIYGNALMALIPLYAADDLGASESALGIFLSVAFAALAAGTISGGWLSDYLQQRKRFLWLVALNIPLFWPMGHATNIEQLTILFSLMWFTNGISSAMTTILTGLFAEEHARPELRNHLATAGSGRNKRAFLSLTLVHDLGAGHQQHQIAEEPIKWSELFSPRRIDQQHLSCTITRVRLLTLE